MLAVVFFCKKGTLNSGNWYYDTPEGKCGPATLVELVALARSGMLRRTDLVWQEGSQEKRLAFKVKGLFPTPPPLPTQATAAQLTVTKATESAAIAKEALSQGSASLLLAGRLKKGLLIAGIVLAVATVVVCVIAVIALRGSGWGQSANNVPNEMGEFLELRAFADVPPPVKEAADAGQEVWELTGWHRQNSDQIILDASLYVVIEQGNLSRIFEKQHHKKGSVLVGNKGKDREIIQWVEKSLDWLSRDESKFEWHWRLQAETPDQYTLTEKLILENVNVKLTTTKTFTVVLDDKVKEGYWQGESNICNMYRGRLAKLPDEIKSKKIAGGTVRLLGRRSRPRPGAQPPVADPKPDPGPVGATAPLVPPAAGVSKEAVPLAPALPPMQEPKAADPAIPEPKPAVPAVPEPKPAVPTKPKLIAVYKVVFPGDVLLTTNELEVKDIVKVYPGEFKGNKGHYVSTLGYAFAEKQEGTELLRRYLVGNKRVFTIHNIDNPNYKEEGMGAWIYKNKHDGTSLKLGYFRKKDSASEYGPEKKSQHFRSLGYNPSELSFYLFDKSEIP